MDRSGRNDPLPLKGAYETTLQEIDPVAFHNLKAVGFKRSAPKGILLHDKDLGCRTCTAEGFGCPPAERSAADDPVFSHVPPPGTAVRVEVESSFLRLGNSLVKHHAIC
jgi:hypothetical protein